MKSFKKIIAIILCLSVFLGVLALYTFAASPKVTDFKIVTPPTKTVFYQDEDWVYGQWGIDEDTHEIDLIVDKYISFTHNPCGGQFPTRGMIDLTGLVVDVSYSDGTTTRMAYKEYKNIYGYYVANILFAPKDGKEFFIGTNTIEVYISGYPFQFGSYEIEICGKREESEPVFKAKSPSSFYINENNLICDMPASLTLSRLKNDFFEYKNVDVSFTKVLRAYKYYGTGSTITVKYPDGKTDIYTIVVPGDIDGNGIVDFNDVELARIAIINSNNLSSAQFIAANVDGMRKITENDLSLITVMAASNSAN